ncbi:MAG: hypothetical protein EZS28_042911 [Streblomastix strix]|uniref:HECT domain-containing protein n=1 Tax=Streblomastix strix TaxID=222440 RepID=A0A5J4TUD9_9EUKA|nr:MAG: hypothetical protein EZS28_042911 [Streblomastix strix]
MEDSLSTFMKIDLVKQKIILNALLFDDDAVDYGGISREWFTLTLPEITNPNYVLFKGYVDISIPLHFIFMFESGSSFFRLLNRFLVKA